jgi:hypothetical protein
MKKLTNQQKACRIIEALVSDDLCNDIEFNIAVHQDYTLLKMDVISINEKFCKIYELSHVANGHCGNPHKDWENDLNKTYKLFKRKNLI